ncbi:hypothetical protein GCM10025771_08500 [Niveibacterium umoris]|uniref:UrcA family protein n=1 Tax=Niveibacterium umoris TaxID=1193620 RepID=A0A840BPJ7_9RHOO|nr:hypothetical protein [Niveibacterium umoris]MBB4013602.1 hypothetical protein [Niveibacterium umoris]
MKLTAFLLAALCASTTAHAAEAPAKPADTPIKVTARPVFIAADAPIDRMVVVGHRSAAAKAKAVATADARTTVAQAKDRCDGNRRG